METPMQRFDPAVGGVLGLKERAATLRPSGWTGCRVEWMALALLPRRRVHPCAVHER